MCAASDAFTASQVAEFVDRAVQITVKIKEKSGNKLKDFRTYVDTQEIPELKTLKHEVEEFAKQFPTIAFEKSSMRYKD
jgi:glycine hydroxymethyltransferase